MRQFLPIKHRQEATSHSSLFVDPRPHQDLPTAALRLAAICTNSCVCKQPLQGAVPNIRQSLTLPLPKSTAAAALVTFPANNLSSNPLIQHLKKIIVFLFKSSTENPQKIRCIFLIFPDIPFHLDVIFWPPGGRSLTSPTTLLHLLPPY